MKIKRKHQIEISGKRFGRLAVLSDSGKRYRGNILWTCLCDCGKTTKVRTTHLITGKVKSCGCLRNEIAKKVFTKHGDAILRTRLYRIWEGMIGRCNNRSMDAFKYYGGRGIKVCSEWLNNYPAFKAWALANGYRDDLTIDRIDSDGDYCPENCRWITKSENCRNGSLKRWRKNYGTNN